MSLFRTYMLGHMGGSYPSEPPRSGEMALVSTVAAALFLAIVWGIGYAVYLVGAALLSVLL